LRDVSFSGIEEGGSVETDEKEFKERGGSTTGDAIDI
jgi:hypothetical protein